MEESELNFLFSDSTKVVSPQKIISDYLTENKYNALSPYVEFDYSHFEGQDVAKLIRENPDELEKIVKDILFDGKSIHIPIIISNADSCYKDIGLIRHSDVNKLVTFDCIVRKVSSLHQEIVYVQARCKQCNSKLDMYRYSGTLQTRPSSVTCPVDPSHKGIIVKPEECVLRDVQFVTLEEQTFNNGKQPKCIDAILPSVLVDKITAGNRATITGYVKVQETRDKDTTLYLEIVNVNNHDEVVDAKISESDIEEFRAISRNPRFYDMFINSYNPDIIGYDNVKLSILFSLVGGFEYGGNNPIRAESHILLCGDPATAKSSLLKEIPKIMPRVIWASGKSTSGCGLTATVTREEKTGRWELEAGALPRANGGVVVCDEFDKMSYEEQSTMHEAMQDGVIHINKATVSQSLQTKTTIIAGMNPRTGSFVQNAPYINQLDLQPSLISRFDLVYFLPDIRDEQFDKLISSQVISRVKSTDSCPLTHEFMNKYILYAKRIKPKMSDEVSQFLSHKFAKDYRQSDTKVVTFRVAESLSRLSMESAKFRLSDTVTMFDGQVACMLYELSLKPQTPMLKSFLCDLNKMNYKEYIKLIISRKPLKLTEVAELMLVNHCIELEESNKIMYEMVSNGEIILEEGYLKLCK